LILENWGDKEKETLNQTQCYQHRLNWNIKVSLKTKEIARKHRAFGMASSGYQLPLNPSCHARHDHWATIAPLMKQLWRIPITTVLDSIVVGCHPQVPN